METPPLVGAATVSVPLAAPTDLDVFPHHSDAIPPGIVAAGAYDLRFAWTRADLHAVQTLRYRVFNEELQEGLSTAAAEGRDADERDPWFHHLMIVHRTSGEVVGTYRLQTAVMAATRHGFYSATLFELGAVPGAILAEAVEIGRACVAPAHRSGRVLRLLWKGLARYLQWNSKRFLFGCCSIAGLDETHAVNTWRALHARSALHDQVLVRPRPAVRALADDGRQRPSGEAEAVAEALRTTLPPLFDGYLALGARICGAPAFDREFGTTDYLVLLDSQAMEPRVYQSFFG
ncbi:MAG TPA: GNAT family N-acyltransferase [Gemmatimonas sp.]|uniref:GNAT family N-acetyltransferase n=1 Tax=Gemmatimonas sp. TaxID=1962908 RepID=UPI002ED99029